MITLKPMSLGGNISNSISEQTKNKSNFQIIDLSDITKMINYLQIPSKKYLV